MKLNHYGADTSFFQNKKRKFCYEWTLTLWSSDVLFAIETHLKSRSPEIRKVNDYVNHIFVYYIRPTTVICCDYKDLPLFSSSYSGPSISLSSSSSGLILKRMLLHKHGLQSFPWQHNFGVTSRRHTYVRPQSTPCAPRGSVCLKLQFERD